MARKRITQTEAERAAPTSSTTIIYDADVAGFGLRITPTGAKAWIVEYRAGAGGRGVAKRRVTLGNLTVMRAEAARIAAKDLLASVRLGADPAADKAKRRETPTVAKLVDEFLETEVKVKRAATTHVTYTSDLRKYVLPAIGAMRATDIAKADIARLHRKIGKTMPVRANRVVAALSSMFTFAASAGIVPDGQNPATGVQKFKEEGRERFLLTDELAALGAALRLAETEGLPWRADEEKAGAKHLARPENRRVVMPVTVTGALRLLLFTGCRLREILHLRWSEVDFERGMLFLPTSKTGKKAVILSAPALAVLSGLPRIGVYVIAGESAGEKDEKPRSDLKRPWERITAAAGLEGLRLRDLRHSFASVGAGGGLGLPIVGKLLGHVRPETTARYAHLDNDPLRRASNRIAGEIAASLGEAPVAGEVVRLKRR